MLKKDTLGAASAKSLGEAFKCGECLHHTKSCHPHREKICADLGVRTFAIAPKCFTPNITKVIRNSEDLAVLASLFQSYTATEKKILLGMLRGAKSIKGQYRFGTKLYLCTGQDVLTSYRCGYVVGYTSSGELILAGSADRKSAGITFFAYLKTNEGLLTHKDWVVKKKQLLDNGRIDSLKVSTTSSHLEKYLNYEVPSIDTSPHFFDPPPKRKNRRTLAVDEFMIS